MTPHGHTENQMVEQPALEILRELAWEIIPAAEASFGPGITLGRETPSSGRP